MSAGSLVGRHALPRLCIVIGGLSVVLGYMAAPALAQGPGLPRTYKLQRLDSPSPILAGGFGLQTVPIGDVNNDNEDDFATNQTEGTPNVEGQVWIYSGATGAQLGTFVAPDPGNPTNATSNGKALVDRWMDRLGDIGSCPAGTAAGQTCTSATIGAPDGRADFLLGAEGVDVPTPGLGPVRDVGRVYVIDGATFSVLKRIDMPPVDRALIAARQAQFPLPTTNVRGGFGRTAATPRGLPLCTGNGGVTACPTTTAIPAAVRIGDMDGGGQPDIVIGANRFTETGATANPASHCAVASSGSNSVICFDAGRTYIYRGEEIANTSPALILDGSGTGQTPPKTLKNLAAQSDANDTTFTRSEIFGHAQMPIGDVGQCRTGGSFPAVGAGDRCSTAARTNVADGKPEIIVSSHRADTPIFNPDPAFFETGVSFLIDGATGAVLFIYNHPEPQPNALFGYTTRQSFPVGDLFGTTLPDLVQAGWNRVDSKAAAGRLYLLNGDVNNAFPNFGILTDPTPTTNERFGVAREAVGDLVPTQPGTEMLVGNFPSNAGLPNALTDLHFMNALSGSPLQTISDPDQQQSSNFGYQVTPLGDLNNDGFLDFATAAPNWDSPGVGGAAGVRDQGRIYIYRSDNSPAPVPPTPRPPTPPVTNYPTPTPTPKPTPTQTTLAGCPSGKRLLNLTSGNDTRSGTAGADLIFALAGNDVIDALAGDDCVDLGLGNDRGEGGAGRDFILGGAGSDRISGNDGNDRLRGGTGVDNIVGASGNDTLQGQSGNDRASGSGGRDRIGGGSGRDRLSGGSGVDTIKGNSGNDVINGGAGRDRISCGSGRDTVVATRGDRVARDCERVRRR